MAKSSTVPGVEDALDVTTWRVGTELDHRTHNYLLAAMQSWILWRAWRNARVWRWWGSQEYLRRTAWGMNGSWKIKMYQC